MAVFSDPLEQDAWVRSLIVNVIFVSRLPLKGFEAVCLFLTGALRGTNIDAKKTTLVYCNFRRFDFHLFKEGAYSWKTRRTETVHTSAKARLTGATIWRIISYHIISYHIMSSLFVENNTKAVIANCGQDKLGNSTYNCPKTDRDTKVLKQ